MAYQPGIPTGTVPLNQDFVNIQNNFTELNNQFLVDHVPLTSTSGSPPNGYHTDIHLVTQPGDPSSSTAAHLYSRVASIPAGGDTQLFYKSVMDTGTAQISGNFAGNNGFGWFSGTLMQWGILTTTSTITSISFAVSPNVNFDNACFIVLVVPFGLSVLANSAYIITSKSKTGFTLGTGNYPSGSQFFWLAIGN